MGKAEVEVGDEYYAVPHEVADYITRLEQLKHHYETMGIYDDFMFDYVSNSLGPASEEILEMAERAFAKAFPGHICAVTVE